MLKIIKVLYLFLNALIIIALLIIHFVLKESTYQYSLLYYTFPLPIIIVIILLLSIFLNRKLRKYNLLVSGLLLIIWLGRSFKINLPEEIKESDLEIVFWNASHDRGFQESFIVNEGIPDVLVLVEIGKNDVKKLRKEYANYRFHISEEGIGIFSKTPLTIEWEKTSKFNTTVLKFKANGISFYAIDGQASLDVPRSWGFKFINNLVNVKTNAVLIGDFNIPLESILLKQIKTNFKHGFSEKGNGFRETWFWNIPLLSLDHIWVSKDLEILKAEKIGTFKSDHSMIKIYVRK